ncbi:hypothetical protein GGR54DRAFT_617096 [Hypoxylon sp. NC1633]|nr:hypothetical protein GGR54DRAFT_617096 [Hypoxylon sp. NC1633]
MSEEMDLPIVPPSRIRIMLVPTRRASFVRQCRLAAIAQRTIAHAGDLFRYHNAETNLPSKTLPFHRVLPLSPCTRSVSPSSMRANRKVSLPYYLARYLIFFFLSCDAATPQHGSYLRRYPGRENSGIPESDYPSGHWLEGRCTRFRAALPTAAVSTAAFADRLGRRPGRDRGSRRNPEATYVLASLAHPSFSLVFFTFFFFFPTWRDSNAQHNT